MSASLGSCSTCGAVFLKATAKFCGKCGTKRDGGSQLTSSSSSSTFLNTTSSPPSQDSVQTAASSSLLHGGRLDGGSERNSGSNPSTLNPPQPASSIPSGPSIATPRAVDSTLVPPESSSHASGAAATPPAHDAISIGEAMLLASSSRSNCADTSLATYQTLSPDGISPEMLQTANSELLRTWRKGSLLGRGTFGSVYLGLLPDGSFSAVKVVELGRKMGTFQPSELVALSREIALMARLKHKNLCQFKGVFYNSEETSVCMFLEFIAGGSLSSMVKRFMPVPPAVIRSWTKQLLTGLLFLHSNSIIHRDIKGDNVLIDPSSDPSLEAQVKLVDFGAAKRITDAVSHSRTVIGTPYWMAPEIVDLTGEGPGYSFKADVWSVGCTVAEMVSGKPPWPTRPNVPSAIMMIGQARDGPTEIPAAQSTPGCLDFMKKCFTMNPDVRPTVEELLQHPWILGDME